MRSFFIIVCIVPLASVVYAQDSTAHKKGVISIVRETLKAPIGKLQSASNPNLNSVTDTIKTPIDSLKAKQKLESVKSEIAEKKSKVNAVKDSITKIVNAPADKINQGLNAVQSQVDSLVHQINKPFDDLNKEVSETQQSVQTKVDGFEQKVQGKANEVQGNVQKNVNKVTEGDVKLSESSLKLPDSDLKLPTQDLKMDNLILGDTKIPNVNDQIPPNRVLGTKVQIPTTESLKLQDTRINAEMLKEKADIKLPEMDKVKDISSEVNKIDSKLGEAEKYEDEIKNIKENGLQDAEKLPEEIEKRVGNIDEVKVLNESAQKITQQQAEYDAMLQKYKDKKLLQAEILRKAKNVANDKLNKYSPAVKEAQEQLAKIKKVNPAVQSLKDIVKKRPNEMKGKPFRQRFVPGVTFQVYNQDDFIIDCAVQGGYRISGRLTTGLGYTYRISFSKSHTNWVRGVGVSGYRIYSDFTLLKSFYVHGEFEALSLDRRKQPLVLETSDNLIYGSYFGLGKRYNLSRKVRGSIMALYKVDYKGELPGLSKINLRVGLDYNLKKQKKKYTFPGK